MVEESTRQKKKKKKKKKNGLMSFDVRAWEILNVYPNSKGPSSEKSIRALLLKDHFLTWCKTHLRHSMGKWVFEAYADSEGLIRRSIIRSYAVLLHFFYIRRFEENRSVLPGPCCPNGQQGLGKTYRFCNIIWITIYKAVCTTAQTDHGLNCS